MSWQSGQFTGLDAEGEIHALMNTGDHPDLPIGYTLYPKIHRKNVKFAASEVLQWRWIWSVSGRLS